MAPLALTGASIEGVNDGAATKPIQAACPYESLSAYYDRSSYGSLHVEGNVVSYHAQLGRGAYARVSRPRSGSIASRPPSPASPTTARCASLA